MSDVHIYSMSAAIKCIESEGYKAALAEVKSKLEKSNCEDFNQVTKAIYTCPPIFHMTYEIGESCQEGYEAIRNIALKSGTVTECMGIFSDATVDAFGLDNFCMNKSEVITSEF